MKNTLKGLGLATLAAATTVVSSLPAQARSNNEHHKVLAQTIVELGVNLKVNVAKCDERNAWGWYWSYGNEMVICQENRIPGSTKMVGWTEEDYDTLRHEAHHLVQDCMDRRQNGQLASVYKDPIALVKGTLSSSMIEDILKAYSKESDHIKLMELEAFSVSALNNPLDQVNDIKRFCFS